MRVVKLILSLLFTFLTLLFSQTLWKQGEFVIKVKRGISTQDVISHLKKKFGDVIIKRAGKSNFYLVKFKNRRSGALEISILVNSLKALPFVEEAEPNYLIKAFTTPNDSLYIYQWGLQKIDAPLAWNFTTGDNLTLVGVVDTGIDYNHPDLQLNVWRNPNEICNDGIDNDGNGFVDDCYGFNAITGYGSALDDNGHGTHVAGIIGAVTNNSVGVAGINWKIGIVGCKFINANGLGSLFDELTCYDYIRQLKLSGYNVVAINASFGGYFQSSEEESAIAQLGNLGIVVVAAAGNDGNDNDKNPLSPCYLSTRLSNVICVAATDENDNLAYFSNYGVNTVQVAAPGVNILSTYLGGGYAYASGTSMATPHVTGLVALLKSYRQSLTPAQVRNIVLNSVDNLTALQGLVSSGGRINLYKALSYADNITNAGN